MSGIEIVNQRRGMESDRVFVSATVAAGALLVVIILCAKRQRAGTSLSGGGTVLDTNSPRIQYEGGNELFKQDIDEDLDGHSYEVPVAEQVRLPSHPE